MGKKKEDKEEPPKNTVILPFCVTLPAGEDCFEIEVDQDVFYNRLLSFQALRLRADVDTEAKARNLALKTGEVMLVDLNQPDIKTVHTNCKLLAILCSDGNGRLAADKRLQPTPQTMISSVIGGGKTTHLSFKLIKLSNTSLPEKFDYPVKAYISGFIKASRVYPD